MLREWMGPKAPSFSLFARDGNRFFGLVIQFQDDPSLTPIAIGKVIIRRGEEGRDHHSDPVVPHGHLAFGERIARHV